MVRKLRPYTGTLLVCLFSVIVMMPLARPGFWPMHDDEQVGRLYAMDVAVHAGHIPPRIAYGLGFGYGYPLFNFYPSLVYYIAEVFVLLGFSYITSLKLMLVLGFILAAVYMYKFSREYVGETGGIIAAVAYTYAPYHALDIYVRGAFPEFWSFVFIPAIFYACKKLSETKSHRYVIYLACSMAGLILSHNLVAFMSSLFIGIYCLYLLPLSKDRGGMIARLLIGGLLGLGLAAFFWIPSFFERQYTMIELLTTELADYHQHFVYLRQLWNSPWGYGGSLYGLEDGLSFQIGKLHILGAIAALVLAIYGIRRKTAHVSLIVLFLGFFVLSIFLLSFYSEGVWDSITPLAYIQFPWRFLLFAVFSSSFLLGTVVLLPLTTRMRYLVVALIIAGIIGLNGSYFQPAKYFLKATDESYTKPEVIQWRTSIMAFEYVPKGVATKPSSVDTTIIDISPQEVASSTATVQSGDMAVATLVDKPQTKELKVSVRQAGMLQLSTFAFPGWEVSVDGEAVSYSSDNKLKLITIPLSTGEHTVSVHYRGTMLQTYSTIISLLSLLSLFFFAVITYVRAKKA